MIVIEKWQGLITSASPYAIPGGGFVAQDNVQCIKPGQIESRKGYEVVTGAGSGTNVGVFQFGAGTVLCFTDAGMLFALTVSP